MKKQYPMYALVLFLLVSFGCDKLNDSANTDKTIRGCGDFVVYKIINEDMILAINIDHSKIGFSKTFRNFENIATADFADIEIRQNCDINTLWHNTCNDVFEAPSCQTTLWKLQNGKLSFKVSKVLKSYGCSEQYLATVILSNATFKKDYSEETQTFENIELKNVRVGWCAG